MRGKKLEDWTVRNSPSQTYGGGGSQGESCLFFERRGKMDKPTGAKKKKFASAL